MNGGVDAHHHIWSLARGDYGWLTPALTPIYRDFSLADMTPTATPCSASMRGGSTAWVTIKRSI